MEGAELGYRSASHAVQRQTGSIDTNRIRSETMGNGTPTPTPGLMGRVHDVAIDRECCTAGHTVGARRAADGACVIPASCSSQESTRTSAHGSLQIGKDALVRGRVTHVILAPCGGWRVFGRNDGAAVRVGGHGAGGLDVRRTAEAGLDACTLVDAERAR
jgi:hypothetical protein